MDTITIKDLAVLCRIGVPDEERANPQRLLITVVIGGDFSRAGVRDDLSHTINYYDVAQAVVELCRIESFKLIEKLAHEIASLIIREHGADQVSVTVKKFILPNTRYVSFQLARDRADFKG